ncbi:3,4-dihydroxy-2-butanone-4-phosphate synthase [Paracoccus onubensis]|uniref:3,4-dihydroxy-2-butanone-4-phosphate synthase n=1 Tax=Paracoccus onubensis TaxID=1675788 RepID=UPI0027314037|nr:3,4-dihydroxy-2-butanone-4-phosphate synthase [Paracoccus onubensis]MDP0926179.1 3,4-dihydroxy-2-butanone-4-phosphate synthase [Paracoccus onubensis]
MNAVTTAISAIRAGRMIIVTDDADREAEGDLVMAASHCTAKNMAFIIRNSCGIVCAPLSTDLASRLDLAPMVARNDAPLGTAFTVTVDCVHGLTTGISAGQRSNTVRALADPDMGPRDFVRPGHVFPLIARDGGVLVRAGHTEAAVDLCQLAGLPPVGVICELANDDGTVMKGAQIRAFAAREALPVVSVDELICWRRENELLVTRSEPFSCNSMIGPVTGYAFSTPFDPVRQFAFVHGDISDGQGVPIRIHRSSVVADVILGDTSLHQSLHEIRQLGRGVLIYLRDETGGIRLASQDRQLSASERRRERHWSEIGLATQILTSLGISSPLPHTDHGLNNHAGSGGISTGFAPVEGNCGA